MKKSLLFVVIILFVSVVMVYSQEETLLLRFPAIYEDQIVFSYGGDLYNVDRQGGVARRLTSDTGYESFPRFSADGKHIAFTAQYDGNTEVYLIPAEGGVPKRLTYTATLNRDYIWDRMGPNNIVMGWMNTKDRILFRSRMREFNSFLGQLYTVGLDVNLPEQLPLPRGGFCSFSPDDSKLAFNRVFREFRTWKRYRGGMADDIWIYDFNSKETVNVTDHPAQDIIPMWHQDDIYFLSDRDENERMNLYVYHHGTTEIEKLTDFVDFDIKFPSLGKEAIVFENGGRIYCYDLSLKALNSVKIIIANDGTESRSGLKDVRKNITNYEISPDGKRALFGARGDVFTVPAREGVTYNLTRSAGIHERGSKWSPDGKWIAYISDASGEDEIYIHSQDKPGNALQLTRNADTYKFRIKWSPDSKKILWSDKKLRLLYVDIQSKNVDTVATSKEWEFNYFNWSPDSRWITYQKSEAESMDIIYIHSLESKKSWPVTDGWYTSTAPSFSHDGKFLFFVSDRDFNPTFSQTEWNHAYIDMARIYFVTLNKSVESPFKPENDKVVVNSNGEDKSKKEESMESKKEKLVLSVEPEGLKDRIGVLPVQAANYRHLSCFENAIYYIRKGSGDKQPVLLYYDLEKKKETEIANTSGYEISADGKKMLIKIGKDYGIIDLPRAKTDNLDSETRLDLQGLKVALDRKAEWKQIFNECWRQMKYFFYAPNMHGVDWQQLKEKYQFLVPHVRHRADLTYIIGEMISELNVGHAYVGGGDMPKVEKVKTGLLGARLQRTSQYYQVKTILPGENWVNSRRSPLTEIGVDVSEGDYILAVNGISTKEMDNIYQHLADTPGKQVILTVNDKPTAKGSREVIVKPIDDESDLYYYNWVQQNIKKVEQKSDGKIGYIHIPDMGVSGLNEFVKYFYPQLRKKALIIDVRGNGGGNVSPMIIERLIREPVMFEMARNTTPSPDPASLHMGPKAVLINEFSASDGDIFPYRFKKYGLGKLIGKRTWGGVVGIRGSLPLLDGGYLYKPEFTGYDTEGKEWVIEGRGVEPDIQVDNDPAKEFAGIDQQLNKAIDVLLNELQQEEPAIPHIPPFPKK
ncbi:protease [candidate division KSB1 bacterium]|nr:protease [candidate division KSB1 bacterium]